MSSALNDKAFEVELVALIPALRGFAHALTKSRSEGEDLAQEALAKAWASRASFEAGTNLKAWTFMILRNQFYSLKRRSWRSSELDPEVAARTLVAVTGDTDRLELDELRRALFALPPEQREALILVGAAGMAYEEVSEILGCPIGTIKSRVSRARDALELLFAKGRIARDGLLPEDAAAAILRQAEGRATAA